MSLRTKFATMLELGADIWVIPECEDPARCSDAAYREFAANGFWWGENKDKGLGIFAAPHVHLTQNLCESGALRWFGSVRVNNAWNLIAVWSNPDKPQGQKAQNWEYVSEIKSWLTLNAAYLTESSLVLGDFNSNQKWAASCGREHAHNTLEQQLRAAGLRSAYHHCSGEASGHESTPTYYMHRSASKPYHIDYAFAAPARIRTCCVDRSRDWLQLSDHAPLVLEID